MLSMNIADQLKIHLRFLLERNGVVIEFFSFTVLRDGVNSVWVTGLYCIQQTPAHASSNHVSIWELRFDFKCDSYLQMKTSSGNCIDSHTPFLRISVINMQEHDPKGLVPTPEC